MMTHGMTDAFPEPLSRDLSFILGLDGPPASADTGGVSAARLPGKVAGSATVGFSVLAALMVGTTATVVSYWPTGREDDAATSPSATSYVRAKPVVSEAVAPAPPRLATLDTAPRAARAPAAPEQASIAGRTYAARTVSPVVTGRAGAPASLVTRSPAVERARSRPRAQLVAATGSRGSDDAGGAAFTTSRTNQPTVEDVGVGRSMIDARVAPVLASSAGASTPAPGLSAPPATMNPAPIPVTNLRAARRDAQDALVGLRRQL